MLELYLIYHLILSGQHIIEIFFILLYPSLWLSSHLPNLLWTRGEPLFTSCSFCLVQASSFNGLPLKCLHDNEEKIPPRQTIFESVPLWKGQVERLPLSEEKSVPFLSLVRHLYTPHMAALPSRHLCFENRISYIVTMCHGILLSQKSHPFQVLTSNEKISVTQCLAESLKQHDSN